MDESNNTSDLIETAAVSKENNNDNNKDSEEDVPSDDFGTETVTRVVDGDTIEINLNGKTEDVRLLLVDTPETKHPSKPVQPFRSEDSEFAKDVLLEKKVKVEYDWPKREIR